MSDEQDPENVKKAWEERLKSGEPLQFFEIDAPMKIGRDKDGALLIDCPTFQLVGFERAGTTRFRIAPVAMQALLVALTHIQSTEGMPEPTGPSRATQ